MPQRHRPEVSESVSGEPLVTYKRLPRKYRPGRTCAVPGCPTVLSIYNSGKQCAAHNPIRFRAAPVPASREVTAPSTPAKAQTGAGDGARARPRVLVDPSGEIRRRAS
jgi:hypothetical protein